MEKISINVEKFVQFEIDLPKYLKVSPRFFIKILNEDLHLYVGKDDQISGLLPEIDIKKNNILSWVNSFKWEAITEDEFMSAYFETKYLIEKLAEI
jgi:hypothetical protein